MVRKIKANKGVIKGRMKRAMASIKKPIGTRRFFRAHGSREKWNAVSQIDLRLSLATDVAFVDFTLPEMFNNYLGQKLIIKDSSGRSLIGYIKAVGTGETLGSEELLNTTYENLTNVFSYQATRLSVPGGQVGNCLEITLTKSYGQGTQAIPGSKFGGLYYTVGYIKRGTADEAVKVVQENTTWKNLLWMRTDSTTWQQVSGYCTCSATNKLNFIIVACTSSIGHTLYGDEDSVKQVLTPAVTGCTITTLADGSDYNWASEETGFNRNDEHGYTYLILDE